MAGNPSPLKQQAHALIDNLPETATWDDVAYETELRASIEHGLADAEAVQAYLAQYSPRAPAPSLRRCCGDLAVSPNRHAGGGDCRSTRRRSYARCWSVRTGSSTA